MSQTTLTTVEPVTAAPRFLIFESWNRLSASEKNSCIGAEEVRSLRGTYMREHVWAPSGCLRERWGECIANYLLSICRSKGNRRSLFGSRRKSDEGFMLELLMLSHSIARDDAVPTVVVVHEHLRVARKAADLLRSHPIVCAYGFQFQPLEDDWELNMESPKSSNAGSADSEDAGFRNKGSAYAVSALGDLGASHYPGYNDPRQFISQSAKALSACLTCTKLNIFCDKTKPRCNNCLRARRDCQGYARFGDSFVVPNLVMRTQGVATHWLCCDCRCQRYRISGYSQCLTCHHQRCRKCPLTWEGKGSSADRFGRPPLSSWKATAGKPLGLVLMRRMLCIRQSSEADRMATAGGYLQLGQYRYLLTAAHPFLSARQRLSQSQSVSSESSDDDTDDEDFESSCSIEEPLWIEDCQIEILPGGNKDAISPFRSFLTYRSPPTVAKIGDPFIPGVKSDWSLIRDNHTPGLIAASHSEHFLFPKVSAVRTPVPEEPAVLYGRTGQQKCSFLGTEAVLSSPGSNTAIHAWVLNLRTQKGDCGVWVVNAETKTLYGMVIACSVALDRTYVVPAHTIAAEIADRCSLVRDPTGTVLAMTVDIMRQKIHAGQGHDTASSTWHTSARQMHKDPEHTSERSSQGSDFHWRQSYDSPVPEDTQHVVHLSSVEHCMPPAYLRVCLSYQIGHFVNLNNVLQKLNRFIRKLVDGKPYLSGYVVPASVSKSQPTLAEVHFSDEGFLSFPKVELNHVGEADIPRRYAELDSLAFPPSFLRPPIVSALPESTGSDFVPVFRVQANMILGGLIVSIYLHNYIADATTLGLIVSGSVLKDDYTFDRYNYITDATTHDLIFSGSVLKDDFNFHRHLGSRGHATVGLNRRLEEYANQQSIIRQSLSWSFPNQIRDRHIEYTTAGHNPSLNPQPQGRGCVFALERSRFSDLQFSVSGRTDHFITPNDVLQAFIWHSMTNARVPESASSSVTTSRLFTPVNIRSKIDPPLSDNYAGAAIDFAKTERAITDLVITPDLTRSFAETAIAIRKSINAVDESYIRQAIAVARDPDPYRDVRDLMRSNMNHISGADIAISNWQKIALYESTLELDLGPPDWVRIPYTREPGFCFIMPDDKRKDYIEVLIQMTEDGMARLLENEHFMSYVVRWVE